MNRQNPQKFFFHSSLFYEIADRGKRVTADYASQTFLQWHFDSSFSRETCKYESDQDISPQLVRNSGISGSSLHRPDFISELSHCQTDSDCYDNANSNNNSLLDSHTDSTLTNTDSIVVRTSRYTTRVVVDLLQILVDLLLGLPTITVATIRRPSKKHLVLSRYIFTMG